MVESWDNKMAFNCWVDRSSPRNRGLVDIAVLSTVLSDGPGRASSWRPETTSLKIHIPWGCISRCLLKPIDLSLAEKSYLLGLPLCISLDPDPPVWLGQLVKTAWNFKLEVQGHEAFITACPWWFLYYQTDFNVIREHCELHSVERRGITTVSKVSNLWLPPICTGNPPSPFVFVQVFSRHFLGLSTVMGFIS